jgi:hypothetical protein
MKVYQQLKFREIAEITKTPEGTLKARFHRAVAELRERLAPAGSETAVTVERSEGDRNALLALHFGERRRRAVAAARAHADGCPVARSTSSSCPAWSGARRMAGGGSAARARGARPVAGDAIAAVRGRWRRPCRARCRWSACCR